MDFNHHNPTNTSCDLHHHQMPMEDHILHDHDQLPLHLLWPADHFLDQTHHLSSPISSTQFPNSALFDGQVPTHPIEEEDKHHEEREEEEEELGAMKEMMFKIAAMQPVDIDPASVRRPKRRNVRISNDPQSVAARLRRERISERMRILQRLVPGGTKMDTATMLDEAIRYVKFLKKLITQLQSYPLHPPLAGDLPADWPSSSHPPPGPAGHPPIHGN